MLLVMTTQGVFGTPFPSHASLRPAPSRSDSAGPDLDLEKKQLWEDTWKRIDQFLPNFLSELFPSEMPQPRPLVATAVPPKAEEAEGGGAPSPEQEEMQGKGSEGVEGAPSEGSKPPSPVMMERVGSQSPGESPSPAHHSSPPASTSPGTSCWSTTYHNLCVILVVVNQHKTL